MKHYLPHCLTVAFLFLLIGACSRGAGETGANEAPDNRRFTKTSLVQGELTEPTEMTILPNKDILIAQRRGEILLYKNGDSTFSQAGKLDVYWKTEVPDVNAEEGLMGIQADPAFEQNRHVFMFYSPSDTSVNRLSRFTFEDDKIDMDSEVVVLEFYSKRDICCHTGGSIAFDKDGLLYLSTGDNSTPFNQPDQEYVLDGYAPLDEREDFEQYDAQRTSGNTNDLRGKILRIKINEDGSYDIPEGNLYDPNKEGTRPEIYVQGNRNPYRISVDQKNGYLYWGEVGPDASEDSLDIRGPRGYDEVNQAREAGFYGWPLFVGDNYAYQRYDYDAGESQGAFDPQNPQNLSPNNTGLEELPPAEPAFIWYPYGDSEEFPQVGTGGRNAMAGPVYYSEMFPEETRLPAYYEGKLFIYDWIRGWIKAVTMTPEGDFAEMEPFIEHIKLNAPIDMEIGPDGRLYLLEYGSGWFAKNDDSGLIRIDYNSGNLPPEVEEVSVNKTSGSLPLDIIARVEANDLEDDQLSYVWSLGNGVTKETSNPELEHTFEEVGEYSISVEVNDSENATSRSNAVSVYAGNEAPTVNINIEGNRSFYFEGQPVTYSVSVEDDDPDAAEDLSSLFVSADYMESPDMAQASPGHKAATEVINGRSLIESSDCQACHSVDTPSLGPSYTSVAERYEDSTDAGEYLKDKVINGGSGEWGDRAMPAHLDLSEEDAEKMVAWILALNDDEQSRESLPAAGEIEPTLGKKPTASGVLKISASYTDKGGPNVKPLSGNTSVYLRSNSMDFTTADKFEGYESMNHEGKQILMVPAEEGSFGLGEIDLTDISAVEINTVSQEPLEGSYTFELRLGAPDGQKAGEAIRAATAEGQEGSLTEPLVIDVESGSEGAHELYIVSKPEDQSAGEQLILTDITFKNTSTRQTATVK